MHTIAPSRHRSMPILGPYLLALLVGAIASEAQVINEFVGNHTGPDTHEFVELFGAPSTDYSNLTILQIEGDAGEDAGVLQSVFPVGSTDADGFWWTGFGSDDFENETYTILLVDGFSGTQGTDLDPGDDGTLDSTPWTSVLDSVAVFDGDAGDRTYLADTVLEEFFDGETFPPGGASRIPNGTDTDAVGDWVRNDWDGAGLPGFGGTLSPSEAVNTPGTANATSLPPEAPALLNEVVLDHSGADSEEYVEIFGDADSDYSSSWVLVIGSAGQTLEAMSVGSTDAQGFALIEFAEDTLPASATLLLVEAWSGTLGQDLDTNDDGTFDVEPWDSLSDDVAIGSFTLAAPGSPTDATRLQRRVQMSTTTGGAVAYSTSVVSGTSASRLPNGFDSNVTGDWQMNDFDGAGLPGFGGQPSVGEAWNSPGTINRTNTFDYYGSVDASSDTSLRMTVHTTIDDHLRFPYSAATTDTWDILEEADQDPTNSSNVLTIYRNSTLAKFGGGNGPYNREHTWPKTYGFPDQGTSSPYTDCHHLRLSDPGYNSDRGSRAFGTCNAGCSERQTDANAGHGGGIGVYPGNSNWFTGSDGGTGTWEAWNHRKGDVARSILYMDLRYEGGNHGGSGLAEPNLEITDNTGMITGTGSNTTGTAYMGRLSVILAWHAQDPPDADEMQRNEVVYRHQGNRNPFVDHPEWADCIYNNVGCGETPLFADGFELGNLDNWD